MPHENETTFEGLRVALIADLAPATPYEMALAEQLVGLEWDAIRHRRLRDELVRATLRARLHDLIEESEEWLPGYEDTAVEEVLADLLSANPRARVAARGAFDEAGIDLASLAAEAWTSSEEQIEPHETRLRDVDRRRRRLLEDYRRLQAVQRPPIEDAEVLGDG